MARYVCPRCNISFCSAACYRSHNLNCTEDFFKRHVCRSLPDDSLQKFSFNRTTQRNDQPGQMLRGVVDGCSGKQKECREEQDNTQLDNISTERLEQLNSIESNIFEKLSDNERRSFLRCVALGSLSSHIDTWVPWWRIRNVDNKIVPSYHDKTNDVEDSGVLKHENESNEKLQRLLSQMLSVPDFSSVSRRPANSSMHFLITDVLYGYCRMARLHNGDWETDVSHASTSLIEFSSVLGEDARYQSMFSVINGCFSREARVGFGRKRFLFALSFFYDVIEILTSRKLVCCALLDAYNIMNNIAPRGAYTRKLWFHSVWAANCGAHCLPAASVELSDALQASLDRMDHDDEKKEVPRPCNESLLPQRKKTLIVEI